MSKYLISTTEVYRVDNDSEAEALINEAKNDGKYTLKKYNCENKERKVKGEIEDQWVRVTLTKVFDDEKEPVGSYLPSYGYPASDERSF